MMTVLNFPINLSNCFQRLRMLRYLLVSVTGWTRDCAQSCAREEPDSITSNSTTPLPTQTKRRMTRCFPSPPTPHNKFTPNPILKQSPTHRHLTFYQMYRCSAVSRNCFPIMSQCAHLHHTFHGQVN